MNLRAKCVNKACPAFGIEKSVMVGQLTGYGAPNEPRHLSVLWSTDADDQIHQRLEGKGCSQDRKQNERSVVGTPANLEKNDQENLQARRREEVLIDSRSARVSFLA